MEETQIEDTTIAAPAPSAETEPLQDPIKEELEKVKAPRTQKEKLLYTKQRIEQQLKELEPDEVDEDRPVTMKDLKAIQNTQATRSALDLAESVENENERELLKHHITHTIKPSGNPQQDLRNAQAIVNAVKNRQLIEQAGIKPAAKSHSTASGAPPKLEEEFTPTAEEQAFMRPPYNLTKEQIIASRG